MNRSWGREHRARFGRDAQIVVPVGARWNGREYVSEVDGLPAVVIGIDLEAAKADADARAQAMYPHNCGETLCGFWHPFARQARGADPLPSNRTM